MASQNGHTEVVECLINHKADVNLFHKDVCLLPSTIRHNWIDCSMQIRVTALLMACQNGHEAIVEILLKFKAKCNAVSKNVALE